MKNQLDPQGQLTIYLLHDQLMFLFHRFLKVKGYYVISQEDQFLLKNSA